MEVALYINHRGQPVTHSSYSARQTFKHCPREFQLTRIDGYNDKIKRAAPLFGKAIEAGVQAYEENGRVPGFGAQVFTRLWMEVQTIPEFAELVYTDAEGSWASLLRAGQEMMRLYEIKAAIWPIRRPLFQQVARKKLFPGTEYDKLENKAIFDMVSFPSWNHPMLPKAPGRMDCNECAVRWSQSLTENAPEFQPCDQHRWREIILDIKTTADELATDLVALDPQLAEYAWQSRIADVGFLWFVKHSHGMVKGSRVTLLEDFGEHKAGLALFVLWAEKESTDKKTGETSAAKTVFGSYDTLKEYSAGAGDLSGNALKDYKKTFLSTKPVLVNAPVTKQGLQFGAARFSKQDMDDIGKDVAQTTAEMLRAHQEGYYPKLSGIRFPNEKCPFCAMRWICLNRPEERDKYLTRRGDEWLDGKMEED